ncbi:ribose 5-phosphate isomerase B [Otoolea muris]|uniref:ribose 5-phosphate isomerase B n=1 Tax=Otoolea muris TaxID=2941515 RepID=UPI00203F67B4|nr:ribose 5-phosphate isomerase B [Otoolea muris]
MRVAIGNDHSAVELKEIIADYVRELGHEAINLGTDTTQSCDYPLYGEKVGRAVVSGEADLGIAICGTGLGISLAANKVKGVRACVCSEPYTARMSRLHNNANVLCFGARVVGSELAKMITQVWLETEFEGGRHQRRVDQIMEIEGKS